jgi:hypothetical protein
MGFSKLVPTHLPFPHELAPYYGCHRETGRERRDYFLLLGGIAEKLKLSPKHSVLQES